MILYSAEMLIASYLWSLFDHLDELRIFKSFSVTIANIWIH